jgi:uncharacterized protein YqgV (UPF0045/DUF77 family)
MLLELSVSLKGKHRQATNPAVDMNRIIDASGLHHETTSKGAVLEGNWEQLMAVAKRCHDEVLKKNDQFTTLMKAVDSKSGDKAEDALEDEGEWLML